MYHKLVDIHLRHHGIQMHKGALAGNAHGQNGLDFGFRSAENISGQLLNGFRHGALGDAHGQDRLRQVHDVAALQGIGRIRGVVERGSGVIRMVLENVRAV